MINLIKRLKSDTIESLANLWGNKDFKKLVECLELTKDKNAKYCLSANNFDIIREVQWETVGFLKVIKIVEQCFHKVNKGDKKNGRRSK